MGSGEYVDVDSGTKTDSASFSQLDRIGRFTTSVLSYYGHYDPGSRLMDHKHPQAIDRLNSRSDRLLSGYNLRNKIKSPDRPVPPTGQDEKARFRMGESERLGPAYSCLAFQWLLNLPLAAHPIFGLRRVGTAIDCNCGGLGEGPVYFWHRSYGDGVCPPTLLAGHLSCCMYLRG